jgi:hypothetical protein
VWPRKKREKVVAEIAAGYVVAVAKEQGESFDQQKAVSFLNEEDRAYGMWKAMMHAGEAYIKSELMQANRISKEHN